MFTHIGDPEPIAPEAVQMYLALIRKELEERKWHKYIFNRRVVSFTSNLDQEPP